MARVARRLAAAGSHALFSATLGSPSGPSGAAATAPPSRVAAVPGQLHRRPHAPVHTPRSGIR
jgi:hypothetical protein